MSFTIKLVKTNSKTHPKNTTKLVDWVSISVTPYNSLCEYISEIYVSKPKTYATLQELWTLKMAHEISLTNSDRRISGEQVLMCDTLSFIYKSGYRVLDEILSENSRNVAKGDFKLVDGGNTLLAGYSGKCIALSYHGLKARASLGSTCTETWDGKYLTYREIFDELRAATEIETNSLTIN
jgi:hypothetical protein